MPDKTLCPESYAINKEAAHRETFGARFSDLPSSQAIPVIRKRRDFLRVAKGLRQNATAFLLQGRPRGPGIAEDVARVGFTCSKKLGNAVVRNRAKRRLREAARRAIPRHGKPGWDYVLVGRRLATAAICFQDLVNDLECALQRMHASRNLEERQMPKNRRRDRSGQI